MYVDGVTGKWVSQLRQIQKNYLKGRPVQVEPMKNVLKASGTRRFELALKV